MVAEINECSNQPSQYCVIEPVDPWDDCKVRQLILPADSNEHEKDANARHVDQLMEAHMEPVGYKKILTDQDVEK